MPVTTTHVQNSFGLHFHGRRTAAPQMAAATVGRTNSGTPTRRHPLTSLEDIAAELEIRLSSSPSADFGYRDGKLYGDSNHPLPLFKSRSLPNFRTNHHEYESTDGSLKPPLRKAKSVRFADTQGLPLVEAVHQLTLKDSSYTANKIVPYDDQEDILSFLPLIATAPVAASSCPRISSVPAPPRTLPQRSSSPPNARRITSPSKLSLHKHAFTFTQPGLEPDYFERVERDNVVLESIREEPRSLHGIVRVVNLTYSKEVTIRWTHDGWRTSHDTSAVFCSNDGNTDRFAFELPINGDDVSFAIRYRVENGEFWDNNRGANYTITSRSHLSTVSE